MKGQINIKVPLENKGKAKGHAASQNSEPQSNTFSKRNILIIRDLSSELMVFAPSSNSV